MAQMLALLGEPGGQKPGELSRKRTTFCLAKPYRRRLDVTNLPTRPATTG